MLVKHCFGLGILLFAFGPCWLRVPKAKGFPEHMGSSLHWGPFLGSFLLKVPYYLWDLKRNLDLENYPFGQHINLRQLRDNALHMFARAPSRRRKPQSSAAFHIEVGMISFTEYYPF